MVPPSLRDEFGTLETATPAQLQKLGSVAPTVKDRMQRAGVWWGCMGWVGVVLRLVGGCMVGVGELCDANECLDCGRSVHARVCSKWSPPFHRRGGGIYMPVFTQHVPFRFAGKGLIGYQPVSGFSNVWRMVVAGDVSYVTTADIDSLLDDMVAMAADL